MKTLYLLDLDHTLIYGSYSESEKVELLFEYSKYLKVYKRPFVNEFVNNLNNLNGDIIVFTTAKKKYAIKICNLLKINTLNILTRKDCKSKDDKYYKKFLPNWGNTFDNIYIIDDSPNVWINTEKYITKIKFIIPNEFRGDPNDNELPELIKVINSNKIIN